MTDRFRTPLRILLVSVLLALAGCAGSKETPGEFIDDAAITTRVKAAFVADKVVSVLNISVETQKGVVHLGGVAKTSEELRQAERIAQKTPGVKAVRNNIVVR